MFFFDTFVAILEFFANFVDFVNGGSQTRLAHLAIVDGNHTVTAIGPMLLRVELGVEARDKLLKKRVLTFRVDVT